MAQKFEINEFVELVKASGSLYPAIGLLAQTYKNQIPKNANLKNSAMSCYISGAFCALQLMGALGCLTEEGEQLVIDFCNTAFNSAK